ncbi:hypothetical protein HYU06_00980 [Candidatus Woesearchaeota archaeon]|nr:hypothetical protein [Candidatus Woesearchaeota archaeon]
MTNCKFTNNRKGVLFTVVTILLLISLFLVTKAFLDRSIELDKTIVDYQNIEKLAYIEDDVVSNSYADLLKISLNRIRRDTNFVNITFNSLGMINPNIGHIKLMQDYRDFIVNNYSAFSNVQIAFTDFSSNFSIFPYNATYRLNGSRLYLYNPNHENLVKISLQARVTEDNVNKNGNNTPANSASGKIIEVKIVDKDGEALLGTDTRILSPTASNLPFYTSFNTTNAPNISVYFGQFEDRNGTLLVRTDFMTANITSITLTYNVTNEKVYLGAGNLTIVNRVIAVNKATEIVLAEE